MKENDLNHFLQKGFILIKEVFSSKLAFEIQDLLWERLEWNKNNPEEWPNNYLIEEIIETQATSKVTNQIYYNVIDSLVGKDRYLPLGKGVGYSPVQFPVDVDKWEATGWHIDGNFFHHHVTSPEQGLIGVELFSDIEPEGGGTAIRIGSHLITAKILAQAEPNGLTSQEITKAVKENSKNLPIVEAIGKAGDVLLMHPFFLHSSSTNRTDKVRFASNRCISLKKPMSFSRNDQNYSMVEKAVLSEVRSTLN